MRDLATGQVLRQWEWELTKGQLKHDSGLTEAKQNTARWSTTIQPQQQQLSAATPAGTTLDSVQAHILALEATWDPLWEEYLKPRWRRQRLGLHHAQERVIEGFGKNRIGESMQRPLELCSWKDREALPPIGKEYQQRYKRVNDRLPKAPRSSQAAIQPAASEPGPSTPPPAKRSKRTKAEPEAAEPPKGKGKAAKAKPVPQPGSWKDREALPPIGKKYQQRYKLVNDRLLKAGSGCTGLQSTGGAVMARPATMRRP
ncbi:uncharacterized protein HaLaN_05085 [Haematococcus lacustris]|uniref:Uncharacterized protein n=1 Tax=Haematococcus lacustris TaxID=44745 RepID=A0A699Z385_HAELA|nr:uncharacterized protein HaLaN_05085 [Haematococcus lacustris]